MFNEINIIAFDVPCPANYGGVIDVFYKIKFLHEKGVKVHLHCFEYGRGEEPKLKNYCSSVSYYKRKTGIFSFLSALPYIVKSRTSKQLKINLLKNDFPILFEGLHSCFLLDDPSFKERIKIVRNHNVEHDYYRHLALVEKNPFKRYFYQSESKKLKRFEPILRNATCCLPISKTDLDYFQEQYQNNQFYLVPGFHQNDEVDIQPGKGDYVLYHGNLSVAENSNAVLFIINNIFKETKIPLKIAGLNPSRELVHLIDQYEHIQLVANPNNQVMRALIANAQINLLYTEQATGLKLKLLNALYNGRYSIVNSKMVEGTLLSDMCLVADEPAELRKLMKETFAKTFNEQEIQKRAAVLKKEYSNENSFLKMIKAVGSKNG